MLFVRRGRWQEGADDYAERARVNSSRPGDDGVLGFPGTDWGRQLQVWYFRLAQLRAGRLDRYRWLCREMLRRYGGELRRPAESVARACLMCPTSP